MVQKLFLMILECEKMKKNVLSFMIFFLIILSLGNVSVGATNNRDIDDDLFYSSITGYSNFIIEDDIKVNSQFNACLLYTSPSPRDS